MKKMLIVALLIIFSRSSVSAVDVVLTIVLDNYPNETSWEIIEFGTLNIIASVNPGVYPRPAMNNQTVKDTISLGTGRYSFIIYDTYGDGICCSYGIGSYTLEDNNGKAFISGGNFGSSEVSDFTVKASGTIVPKILDIPEKITGFILYPDFGSEFCSPASNAARVENAAVTLTTLGNGQSNTVYTNSSGYFEMNKPSSSGLIKLEASVVDNKTGTAAKKFGISTADLLIIQDHLLGIEPLKCPVKRMAADFNLDGKIDTTDQEMIHRLILNLDYTYPIEPWRFVPNLTTYPTAQHPDMNFIGEYWNTGLPAQSGKHYPFEAELNLLGKEYSYAANPSSWMEEVNEWYFKVGDECSSLDFGFWLIKLGEVNGSLDTDTLDFAPPVSSAISGNLMRISSTYQGFKLAEPQIISQSSDRQREQELSLRSNEKKKDYILKVSVKSDLPLDAYQIGLNLDPTLFKVKKIAPKNDEKLKQNLKRNYNDKQEELDKGNIKTLYISEFEKNFRKSIDIRGWTELVNLEIELKNNSIKTREAIERINFDRFLMPTEFIYGSRLINKDVEVRVDLVEID